MKPEILQNIPINSSPAFARSTESMKAFRQPVAPVLFFIDDRFSVENTNFMCINGTSMANPHAAGAFALLKQTHPDWSAAEARSALMTTARQNLVKTFGPAAADPFDIGASETLPSAAYDPGLAYDAR
jgi:hypothetical protein